MTDHPILFTGPMVRALLDGSKTQTRRALKIQPVDILPMKGKYVGREWVGLMARDPEPNGIVIRCKFGVPGDRLWVRETFQKWPDGYAYRADYQDIELADAVHAPWKPSIHMPRRASRIILEVTGVRVERLQDISDADAMNEGAAPRQPSTASGIYIPGQYRLGYRDLWQSINGPGSWETNPWVWVIEFKRITP